MGNRPRNKHFYNLKLNEKLVCDFKKLESYCLRIFIVNVFVLLVMMILNLLTLINNFMF